MQFIVQFVSVAVSTHLLAHQDISCYGGDESISAFHISFCLFIRIIVFN